MIHILWCTIRPTYFTSFHPRWIINAENKSNIKTYVCVNNETWQLDHIVPISSAKTEDDIYKLNHYSNLRPLCSKKNLEKSNKII